MQSMRQLLTRTESHDASERLEEVRAKVVAVSELLAAHNDLEENQVYLWAEKLLNTSEKAALERAISANDTDLQKAQAELGPPHILSAEFPLA